MATANQVLKAALQKILVQDFEAELEQEEYEIAILEMNNFMLDLDARGVSLGYTEVSSLSDDITIPTGALRGLINNLAIQIAPYFNGKVTQVLASLAAEGLNTMRLLGKRRITSSFPSSLPIGSGNEDSWGGGTDHKFYPEPEDQILAETTGSIGLEGSTP